jgi:predicted exporter
MPRRGLAVSLWVVALAACVAIVVHTRFVADLSMFLPQSPTEEQRVLVDQLRDGALARTLLIGIDGADGATRARLSAELKKRLEAAEIGARPGPELGQARVFSLVANGQSTGFVRERDLLLANRYALSPAVTPERFTVEGLRAAVAETVDLLASPAGMLVKPFVTRDPTAEMLAVIDRLRPEGGPRTVEGVWASRDGRRALLLARTKAAGSDTDAQARAVAGIEAAFDEALREIGPRPNAANAAAGVTSAPASAPGTSSTVATLVITGPGAFAVKSRALVKHDVERLAIASLVLVAAILLAAYRSPLTLALGLVPVVSGAAAGVAAVSLGFDAVHGITLGFGTTLIGEAIDYAIYLFVQSERSHAIGDADWVARFWPTIRLGVLTSIAGFSALLFSGLPGLAQLGLYSITGLVAAAAVTRFVLPALLPSSLRIRDLTGLGEVLMRAVGIAARARWIAIVLVVIGIAALVLRPLPWDTDIASLNPISTEDRRQDALMRADLGAADARTLISVRGQTADEALAGAERVGEKLDALVASGALAGYESAARIVPSQATQARRIAALPAAAELRDRLAVALQGSPLSATKLTPFIEDVERARAQPPLTPESLAGTTLGAALDGLLFRDASGRWNAMVSLRPPEGGTIDAQAVRSALAASGTGALVVDVKAEADRLYAGYFERAIAMSAVGLAIIVALLFTTLRSPARVARVLAPLFAGVIFVAAWHVLGGTRMNLLHLVGLLLVVAIGSNYALFFDRMAQDPAPAARTLASLTLANVTTVASFGVLAISEIPVLHAMGSTVAIGALATLVFSAVLAGPRAVTIPAGTRP